MSRLLLLGAAGAGLALFFVARGKAVKAAAAAAPVSPAPAAVMPAPVPIAVPPGTATPYGKIPLPGPRAPQIPLESIGATTSSSTHPGYVFVNGHWERTRAIPMSGLGGFGRISRPGGPRAMGFAGNYNQVAGQRPALRQYGTLAHMGRGSLGGKVR